MAVIQQVEVDSFSDTGQETFDGHYVGSIDYIVRSNSDQDTSYDILLGSDDLALGAGKGVPTVRSTYSLLGTVDAGVYVLSKGPAKRDPAWEAGEDAFVWRVPVQYGPLNLALGGVSGQPRTTEDLAFDNPSARPTVLIGTDWVEERRPLEEEAEIVTGGALRTIANSVGTPFVGLFRTVRYPVRKYLVNVNDAAGAAEAVIDGWQAFVDTINNATWNGKAIATARIMGIEAGNKEQSGSYKWVPVVFRVGVREGADFPHGWDETYYNVGPVVYEDDGAGNPVLWPTPWILAGTPKLIQPRTDGILKGGLVPISLDGFELEAGLPVPKYPDTTAPANDKPYRIFRSANWSTLPIP